MAAIPIRVSKDINDAAPGKIIEVAVTADVYDASTIPRYNGILLTVAGAIKLTNWDDTLVTLPINALALNVIHPLSPKMIWTTGTAATVYGVK